MTTPSPDTIVLIHGLWVTPRSWEEWITYYQDKGIGSSRPLIPASRWRSRRCARTPM